MTGEHCAHSVVTGNCWQGLLAAVQFLSRVPLPQSWLSLAAGGGETRLAQGAVWFPVVGGLVGLATGGAIWLAARVWPLHLAVLVGLAFEALLTGALHEDALADFCDAFGGGWTRDDVLRILGDSRLGSYGVLGLMLGVLLRYTALASMSVGQLLAASVAAGALARWAMLLAMAMLSPIAGRPSLANAASRQMSPGTVACGALWALPTLLPLAWLAPAAALASPLAVVVLACGMVHYVQRRIGGVTGDCLGALCYTAQVLVLLICTGWGSI